ncbi:Serine/threonine-protein kinase tel1 [Tulasnella sp. 403]|nr:Serine/threonine-protein kinase tel1 [Tulasnella sp. 403]
MTVLDVFKTDPLYSWTVHPLKLRRKQQELNIGTATTARTADSNLTGDTKNSPLGHNRETDTVERQADRALASVAKKLDKTLSVSHDVNELIAQATDVSNLANIFHGMLLIWITVSSSIDCGML